MENNQNTTEPKKRNFKAILLTLFVISCILYFGGDYVCDLLHKSSLKTDSATVKQHVDSTGNANKPSDSLVSKNDSVKK